MIGIGFTRRDVIRAVWTFVFAALGFVIAVQADIIGGPWTGGPSGSVRSPQDCRR